MLCYSSKHYDRAGNSNRTCEKQHFATYDEKAVRGTLKKKIILVLLLLPQVCNCYTLIVEVSISRAVFYENDSVTEGIYYSSTAGDERSSFLIGHGEVVRLPMFSERDFEGVYRNRL